MRIRIRIRLLLCGLGRITWRMGIRSRLTRESLARVDEGELEAFFDDVVEVGLVKACEARIWTLGAVLNWLRASDDRWGGYQDALKARAEVRFHEGGEIVDQAMPDDVAVAKLRSAWRRDEAKVWSREQYGDRVAIEKSAAFGADAGLIGLAGALLARLAAPVQAEKIIGGEVVEADDPVEAEIVAQRESESEVSEVSEAGEVVRESAPSGTREQHGYPPPDNPPRRALSEISTLGPI